MSQPFPPICDSTSHLFLTDFRPEWEVTRPFELTPADHLYDVVAAAFA
ncbi:MAG TPA: hypothetical protein VKE74_02135 [Gemmataceae bacterium]|nr:hypothetical protein [Gemmataceae bacterium]